VSEYDTDIPPDTNPHPDPPPYEEETGEDLAARFARIAGNMVRDSISPVRTETAELRSELRALVALAQKIFDEFHALKFELGKRVDAVERRLTAAELEILAIKDRLGG
jgi:hypothetical protein